MSRLELPLADCCRVLGIAPSASWQQIRQAYLDLVRVWHPDRFQSDPELRIRAEQQLQKINEAYSTLKNAKGFRGHPDWPLDPQPETCSSTIAVRSGWFAMFLSAFRLYPATFGVAIVLGCLLPAALLWRTMSYLWVGELDPRLIQSRLHRPAILMPSRIISPLADISINSSAFAGWSRGEFGDLWTSVPVISDRPAEPIVPSRRRDRGTQTGNGTPSGSGPRSPAPAILMPQSGAEIQWVNQFSGTGELWVTNKTNLDAFAALVPTHQTRRLRGIYIKSRAGVCIRNIAAGTYDFVTEIGEDWDSKNLCFRAKSHTLARSGPFAYFDVVSAEGTIGCRYDLILKAADGN